MPRRQRGRLRRLAGRGRIGACIISDGLTVIGSPLICCRNAMTDRISFLDRPIGFLLMYGMRAGYSFGLPFMTVVQIDIGLRLRQAFENKLPRQLGADAFQVRTPGRFARTDGMAQRALAFAEKYFLSDGRHIGRRF